MGAALMVERSTTASGRGLLRAKTPAELRRYERQVVAGSMVAPMHGMFVDASEWASLSPKEQVSRIVTTLSEIHEGWVFCLFSAAALYGLEIAREQVWPIHRCSHGKTRLSRNRQLTTHHAQDVVSTTVAGVAVTSPLQTVVDCLCALDFGRALAIADSAMRVLGLSQEDMRVELALRGECAGWKIARDAIAYADPLSMNGGESVARAVMIEQGFMIPQLQVQRCDPLNADEVFYVDYLWNLGERGLVAGELDGRDKYMDPAMTNGRDAVDVMRDERLRESRISAECVRVLRFSYRDVMDRERFTKMLDLYGIPRGAARPIGE